MGLKHPVCWVVGCTRFSQQYLAVHCSVCVYAAIATHKGGCCRWRHKGQGTTVLFFYPHKSSLAVAAAAKVRSREQEEVADAPDTAWLLLPFPFPHKARLSKAFPAISFPLAVSLPLL